MGVDCMCINYGFRPSRNRKASLPNCLSYVPQAGQFRSLVAYRFPGLRNMANLHPHTYVVYDVWISVHAELSLEAYKLRVWNIALS
jgi:hypothetical protein